ncbi:MAG TPA: metal-dependent hydrolase [Pirellulaceae bacterium]|nr:metal-dependent hydrolase [Pirellulaceae bacterium]HMO92651.1 metal-dependent hydrolase [Pirellulaceae bacterium]HMP70201.1 metal-dependent hydrolase [Pirellulaceae bacterium]
MSIKLTWFGHATWMLSTTRHRILIDPFFEQNPSCSTDPADVEADFIVVSHGHFDHVADCAAIANRLNIPVLANFEIATWLEKEHAVKHCIGMNVGGKTEQEFGSLKLTPALHSSQLPDGSYGGVAAGLLFRVDNLDFYFACDTALFSDMKLIGEIGLEVAILPIGDVYTMGIEDSVTATQWLKPRIVFPTHYNTWPPIAQDANEWADFVRGRTGAKPVVLQPGETYEI